MNTGDLAAKVDEWSDEASRWSRARCVAVLADRLDRARAASPHATPTHPDFLAAADQLLAQRGRTPETRAAILALAPDGLPWAAIDRIAAHPAPSGPETLNEIRAELGIAYAARRWGAASEMLGRLSGQALLPEREARTLQGWFWWLSLFGRQIRWERTTGEYAAQWTISLPWGPSDWPTAGASERARLSGWWEQSDLDPASPPSEASPGEWIVAAWCSNPRAPRPLPQEQAPSSLEGDEPPVAEAEAATAGVDRYVQENYIEFEPVTPFRLSATAQDRLERAVAALSEARRLGSQARVLGPMLALANFHRGEAQLAADEYRLACGSGIAFETIGPGGEWREDYAWELRFMQALCLRRAGHLEAALQALERAREADPNFEAGCEWWGARWLCEECRYDDAAKRLRRAYDAKLPPAEGWQTSLLLVVAETGASGGEAQMALRRLREADPQGTAWLEMIAAALVPRFRDLTRHAQDTFLLGLLSSRTQPGLERLRTATESGAVMQLARAVESELRASVFEPFQRSGALPGPATHGDRDPFRAYCAGSGKITLGQMANVLRFKEHESFNRWLAERFGESPWPTRELGRLAAKRGAAAHDVVPGAGIERALADAAAVLRRLTARRPSAAP